ncbi:MAG: hypothetical protein ACYDD4_01920 [Acidimicrobiales bacterium]
MDEATLSFWVIRSPLYPFCGAAIPPAILGAMLASASPKRTPMTNEHKQALARGRDEGRAVRRYLEAIEHQRPRRGRKRTPDSVKRRLSAVKSQLAQADALSRLHLLQEQADLEAELAKMGNAGDITTLEKAFVKVAKAYGKRKGIGYGAWRAAGVSAAVLSKAGITRAD